MQYPNAHELSQGLAGKIEALCAALLPQGRREGNKWVCGDVHGKPGQSLKVCLVGEKAGRWKDFHGGEGGDALDLVKLTQGLASVNAAKDWASSWLGIDTGEAKRNGATRPVPAVAWVGAVPDRIAKARAHAARMVPIAGTAAECYLLAERGIGAVDFGDDIGFLAEEWRCNGKREGALVVVARDGGGEVVAVHLVYLVGDKKATKEQAYEGRPKRTFGPVGKTLGWVIPATAEQGEVVVFVEGPEDGLTAAQATGFEVHATCGISNFFNTIANAVAAGEKRRLVVAADPPGKSGEALDKQVASLRADGIDVAVVQHPAHDLNDLLKAEGPGAVRALIDSATWPDKPAPEETEPPAVDSSLIELKPLSAITLSDAPAWLVEDFLPKNGFSVFFGPPGSSKGFLLLDIGMRVASGLPFHGREVEQGVVVYIAAEAGGGMGNRLLAFAKANLDGAQSAPFYLISTPVDLCDPKADTARVIQSINVTLGGVTPALIVVDTLARTMGAGDENSAPDMGSFIRNVDLIRDETGTSHLSAVHHSGKDRARGARGHNSLLGAVDTEIEVEHDEISGTRTATVTKQRDAEKGNKFCFKLNVVELGTDTKGKTIKSCVVVETEAPEQRKEPRLNKRQSLAKQVIWNYFIDNSDERWMSFDLFANLLKAAGLDIDKKARSRAREQLAHKGLIRLRHNELSRIDPSRRGLS